MALNKTLPKNQFDTVIRQLKLASIDKVKQIKTGSFNTLRRLGVKRDVSKAVAGVPNGSDNLDVGQLEKFTEVVVAHAADANEAHGDAV